MKNNHSGEIRVILVLPQRSKYLPHHFHVINVTVLPAGHLETQPVWKYRKTLLLCHLNQFLVSKYSDHMQKKSACTEQITLLSRITGLYKKDQESLLRLLRCTLLFPDIEVKKTLLMGENACVISTAWNFSLGKKIEYKPSL